MCEGEGERSEATIGSEPSASVLHSASHSAAGRSGGAHFADRAEALGVRLGQQQVVRAGLAGDVGAAGRAPRPPAPRPARVETWTTCSAQPSRLGEVDRAAIASVSATAGRESSQSRIAVRPSALARASRPEVISSSRRGPPRQPEGSRAAHALVEREVVGGREVVDAAVGHERLVPDHAALAQLVHRLEVAGDQPAPQREVHARVALPARALAVEGRAVERGGGVDGMSTAVVAPPAASAAVPVAKPSQSARPGSLRCTCASTTPGSSSSPRASISSLPPPSSSGPTAAITPSRTPTSSCPPRISRSNAVTSRAPPAAAWSRRAPPPRPRRAPPRRDGG